MIGSESVRREYALLQKSARGAQATPRKSPGVTESESRESFEVEVGHKGTSTLGVVREGFQRIERPNRDAGLKGFGNPDPGQRKNDRISEVLESAGRLPCRRT